MTSCDQTELLRDYAFDEMNGEARAAFERHLTGCEDCAVELGRFRATTSALRALPDREIPQRIAFVSDKIFEPSPTARFFGSFWNSAARLGFASACVIACALVVFAYHRPAEIRIAGAPPGATSMPTRAEIAQQINDAVSKAVTEVHNEDAVATEAALKAAEVRQENKYRNLLTAMDENMSILEKRSGYSVLAGIYAPGPGGDRQ